MARLLVTGGSRGIGRAVALKAAAAGWSVAFSYRADEVAAQQVVDQITTAGGHCVAFQADVTEEGDNSRLFDQAEDALGGLDAVVINAGIVAPSVPLADMDAARIRHVLDTNVLGAILTAREAARRLPRDPEGPMAAMVFVSSMASRLGSPFEYVDYAASKGAIDTLTVGLAKELAPQGIRVNAVRPGLIDTDIHASGGRPDRARELAGGVPLKRPGKADEVADAILWLCSDAASYTTGGFIDVSGGR